MATTTLPTETRLIDNQFTETWYDIRKQAIDNILLATPLTAILKERGCFVPQEGSTLIERTIKYAVGNATTAIAKGDTLPSGVAETETAAFWTFRNNATAIQRDLITDAENSGSFKIKDYVAKRLKEARDSMTQKEESDFLRATVTGETGKEWQGLFDILPLYADCRTGTFGRINRPLTYAQVAAANGVYEPSTGNVWWGPKYKQLTLPSELNLITDMKVLFNSIFLNQEAPNLLLSDQALYELYEEFAVDKSQIVKSDRSMLADLGFTSQEYKGATWIWTPNYTAGNLGMFNTNYIEVVYRPNLWFDMTEWKSIPLQTDRIAHIISSGNVVGTQPRRHGLLTSSSVS